MELILNLQNCISDYKNIFRSKQIFALLVKIKTSVFFFVKWQLFGFLLHDSNYNNNINDNMNDNKFIP